MYQRGGRGSPLPRHLLSIAWLAVVWVLLTLPGDTAALEVPRWMPRALLPWLDKGAHFALFLVLGWLFQGSFALHLRRWRSTALAVSSGCAFGALTEWWQLRVPGRTGELGDLLFDALGALLGALARR